MMYHLIIDLSFVCAGSDDSDEAFDAFTDRVMDELVKLAALQDTGIVEPDLTVSLAERKASVLLGTEASTLKDAVRLFMANVRCALHAAECNTADWPNYEPVEEDFPPVREAHFTDA